LKKRTFNSATNHTQPARLCKRIVSYIIIILFFTNCSHYILNNNGYVRPPKKHKFHFSKKAKKLENIEIIDTTAIYYMHNSYLTTRKGYTQTKKYKRTDRFIRFYGNGRLKIQHCNDEYPKIEDVNNINNGIIGYYLLSGDEIKIEIYTDINGGSNQLKYGHFDENKNLIIYDYSPNNYITIFNLWSEKKGRELMKKEIQKEKYEKTKINGMSYIKPNW